VRESLAVVTRTKGQASQNVSRWSGVEAQSWDLPDGRGGAPLALADRMDLLRRGVRLAPFVVIAVSALLVARTGNTLLELALQPLPTKTVRSHPIALEPVATVAADRFGALLGLPQKAEAPLAPDDALVRSRLPVKLLGTLVNEGDAEWSMASVEDATSRSTTTCMLHDLISGAEVLAIERARIIVLNRGRREFIDGALPSDVALSSGIRQVRENAYELPRSELERNLPSLANIAVVPAFKDGQAEGFRLSSIRADSIYAKIGIQNGDVVKRINGVALTSPERALEAWSRIRATSRIDLEVDRRGAVVNQTYTLE
jgi:general secretion pathway protein C